jgi:hypothetical protein
MAMNKTLGLSLFSDPIVFFNQLSGRASDNIPNAITFNSREGLGKR